MTLLEAYLAAGVMVTLWRLILGVLVARLEGRRFHPGISYLAEPLLWPLSLLPLALQAIYLGALTWKSLTQGRS